MANASLGNYKDAINDLNVAKTVELSSGAKSQIESELKTLSDQCGRMTNPPLQHTVKQFNILGKIGFIIGFVMGVCFFSRCMVFLYLRATF